MDSRSSSLSSSSSVPNLPHQACHLFQTSLKPSLSSLYTAPTHLPDLSGSSQPSRPSHYDFTVPAFTRAHPPALPKIFQPTSGSGTCTHKASAVIKNTTEGCCSLNFKCTVYTAPMQFWETFFFIVHWVFTMVHLLLRDETRMKEYCCD